MRCEFIREPGGDGRKNRYADKHLRAGKARGGLSMASLAFPLPMLMPVPAYL